MPFGTGLIKTLGVHLMQAVRRFDCLWKYLVFGHEKKPCFWKGLPLLCSWKSPNSFHLSSGARLAGNVSLHKASMSGSGCLAAVEKEGGAGVLPSSSSSSGAMVGLSETREGLLPAGRFLFVSRVTQVVRNGREVKDG